MAQLPDDVRQQLRRWCGDQGLHTELRAFLRHRLVELVSRGGPPALSAAASAGPPDAASAPLVLLAADLLRHLRLWYTHAVLSAETGLSPQNAPADALLSRENVLRVTSTLGVDGEPVAALYATGDQPLLNILLSHVKGGKQQNQHVLAQQPHKEEAPKTELQLLQSRRCAEQLVRQQQEQQLRQQREQLVNQHRLHLRQTRRKYKRKLHAQLQQVNQQHREEITAIRRDFRTERSSVMTEVQKEGVKLRKRAALLDEREDLLVRRERRLSMQPAASEPSINETAKEVTSFNRSTQTEDGMIQYSSSCHRACQTTINGNIHCTTAPSDGEHHHNVTFDINDEPTSQIPCSQSPYAYYPTHGLREASYDLSAVRLGKPAPLHSVAQSQVDWTNHDTVSHPISEKSQLRPARRSTRPRRVQEPLPQRIIHSLERRVADLETSIALSPDTGKEALNPSDCSRYETQSADPGWRERQRAVLDSLLVTAAGLESQVQALQLTASQLQLLPRPGQLQRPVATGGVPLAPPLSPPPLPPPLPAPVAAESDSLLSATRGRLAALSATAAELQRQFSHYQTDQRRQKSKLEPDSVKRQLFQSTEGESSGLINTNFSRYVEGVMTRSEHLHAEQALRRSREVARLSPNVGVIKRSSAQVSGDESPYTRMPNTPPEREPRPSGVRRNINPPPYLDRIPYHERQFSTFRRSSVVDTSSAYMQSGVVSNRALTREITIPSSNSAKISPSRVGAVRSVTGQNLQDFGKISTATISPASSRLRWLLAEPANAQDRAVEPPRSASPIISGLYEAPSVSKISPFQSKSTNMHIGANNEKPITETAGKETLSASVKKAFTIGQPVMSRYDGLPAEAASSDSKRMDTQILRDPVTSNPIIASAVEQKSQLEICAKAQSKPAPEEVHKDDREADVATYPEKPRATDESQIETAPLKLDLDSAWRKPMKHSASESIEQVFEKPAVSTCSVLHPGSVLSHSQIADQPNSTSQAIDNDFPVSLAVDLDSAWRPLNASVPNPIVPSEHELNNPSVECGVAEGRTDLVKVQQEQEGNVHSEGSVESLPPRPRSGNGSNAASAERSGALLRSGSGWPADPPLAAAQAGEATSPSNTLAPAESQSHADAAYHRSTQSLEESPGAVCSDDRTSPEIPPRNDPSEDDEPNQTLYAASDPNWFPFPSSTSPPPATYLQADCEPPLSEVSPHTEGTNRDHEKVTGDNDLSKSSEGAEEETEDASSSSSSESSSSPVDLDISGAAADIAEESDEW